MSNYLDTNQDITSLSFNTGDATSGNTLISGGVSTNNFSCSSATIPNVYHNNVTGGVLTVTGLSTFDTTVYTNVSTGTLVITDDIHICPTAEFGYLHTVKYKDSIADNVATSLFKINTADVSPRAGGYSVKIWGSVGHAVTSTSTNTAVKYFDAQFSRCMSTTSVGETSAIAENSGTSAATTAGTRDIGTIAVTATEVTEFQVDVKIQVDLSGSSIDTCYVIANIEIMYHNIDVNPTVTY